MLDTWRLRERLVLDIFNLSDNQSSVVHFAPKRLALDIFNLSNNQSSIGHFTPKRETSVRYLQLKQQSK